MVDTADHVKARLPNADSDMNIENTAMNACKESIDDEGFC